MNKLWLTPLLLIGLLVGCSSESTLEPVDINLDVDSCARCNMGILEQEHAAQIIMKDGTPKVYDDIGCMLNDLTEIEEDAEIGYVRDYLSNDWIDIGESTFVQEGNIATPMSYGIVAFQKAEDAEAFQTEHGGDTYSLENLKKLDMDDFKHAEGHGEHDEEHGDHAAEGTDSHD